MNRRDRIVVDPDVPAGKPVIEGTRVSVEFVIALYGRFEKGPGAEEATVGIVDGLGEKAASGSPRTGLRPGRRCPESLGRAPLIVEKFGVIEVGSLDVGGGARGDGAQFLDGGLGAPAPEASVAFAQGFGCESESEPGATTHRPSGTPTSASA